MDDPKPPTPSGQSATDATVQGTPISELGQASDATVRADSPVPPLVASADPTDSLIGKTLQGRYTVLERLGAGGMSIVYLARHEQLKKLVAVKLLRQEVASSTAAVARFHREAMAAASIGDPHIVDVNDYFSEAGQAFLVMERLDGLDLRQTLARTGALEPGRAIAIVRQILRALVAAHGHGIVHRDLKAENVFLCERDGHDFVKLLDFGISKILQPLEGSGGTAATGTGVVMGTPQYIAPEQAHGAPNIDHRADIYSLGVICYEMLTGTLPFSGSSALEVLMKHVQEEPQPLRQRRPDLNISPELERLVLRALAKEPDRRFQSAEEMLAALPDALTLPGGFGSGAMVPALAQPRRAWLLPVVVGAVLVAGGAALLLFRVLGPPPPPPPPPPLPALTTPSRPDARRPDLAPVRQETVRIIIKPVPESAEVLLGGKSLGSGTVEAEVPRGELPLAFTLRAAGFVTKIVDVTPAEDRKVQVKLERDRRRPPAKKKKSGDPNWNKNPYQ